MAGHKFSGYISKLWQALFAFFAQLFAGTFRFTTSTGTSPNQQPTTLGNTVNCSDRQPFASEHEHSHSLQKGDGALAQQQPPLQDRADLEKGLSSSQEDDAMAASKKRGGRGRSGVKPNGATNLASNAAPGNQRRPKDKENVGPGKSTNQASGSSATVENSTPSGEQSLTDSKMDDQAKSSWTPATGTITVKQPNGQKSNAMMMMTPATNRGPSLSTKPVSDNNRKDPASIPGREAPKAMAGSLTPAVVAPVVPKALGNKSEIRQPASHSQPVTQTPDPVSASKSTEEDIPLSATTSQIAQATTPLQGLTLSVGNSLPAPHEKQGQDELDKDSAAVEAAAVPLPTIVPVPNGLTVPLANELVPPKPLAPLVTPPSQVLPGLIEPTTEEGKIERAYHLRFMREALDMGQLALNTNETPVGCVLVYHGRTIAKGMNATNVTRNGTRHAEFMALSALLSHQPDADVKDESTLDDSCWGDVDPANGHIYPYGQKLHPSPKVDQTIIEECVLYVTVEPCVMCASLLRQLRVKKVYFGAVNDKFGGTGGVFRIHLNSKPVPKPEDRPYQNGYGPHDTENIVRGRAQPAPREDDDGDGGNVEPGYPVEGGYLRDEAVSLLRRFYVQENNRAPQPRKKEGRAARLYAMEAQANGGGVISSSDLSDGTVQHETPADIEPTTADQEQLPATPVQASNNKLETQQGQPQL